MNDFEEYINYLLEFYYSNPSNNPLKFEEIYEYYNSLANKVYELLMINRKED